MAGSIGDGVAGTASPQAGGDAERLHGRIEARRIAPRDHSLRTFLNSRRATARPIPLLPPATSAT